VHYLPQFPRRLYVEAPSLREVQHLMTYSQSTHHGCGIRLIDDVDREWLQSDSRSLSLRRATWVKITDRGLYQNDLALVVESPRQGDVVTLAVVPRFTRNKRKRKGTRPSPVLLDTETLAQLPFKENFHRFGSRKFHSSGLEFLLAPAAHTLELEDNPSEEQLRPFEQSFFQCSGEINRMVLDAVKSAYHQKVRETWRVGDQIQVRGGEFIGWRGHLVEIDSPSRSALVSILDLETSKSIHVQIDLARLERYFQIGDVVRVVIGLEKGRKGSIISIEDEVATIVEVSSEAGQFFVEASIFFPLFLFV
jgi:ribosomal protein L24